MTICDNRRLVTPTFTQKYYAENGKEVIKKVRQTAKFN